MCLSRRTELGQGELAGNVFEVDLNRHIYPYILGGAPGDIAQHVRPFIQADDSHGIGYIILVGWMVGLMVDNLAVYLPFTTQFCPLCLHGMTPGTNDANWKTDVSALLAFLHSEFMLFTVLPIGRCFIIDNRQGLIITHYLLPP